LHMFANLPNKLLKVNKRLPTFSVIYLPSGSIMH
jgi:hypothetical protein